MAAASALGCGEAQRLSAVETTPPDGARQVAVTSTHRTSSDPPVGSPIYRLDVREGQPLAFAVRVRNISGEPVTVTGVRHDPDRDGAFVPRRVEGAPVHVPPGDEATLTVQGRVAGCQYGGQLVTMAAPDLQLGDAHQTVGLRMEIQLQTPASC